MAIQLTPDAVQLGGDKQPSLWATGTVSFGNAARKQSLDIIDLTANDLNPRIRYTGPAHYYWNEKGILEKSTKNVWPLEYVNGIPVGRHEPEPAATNYQGASQCDVLSGLDYIVDGYSNQVTTTGPNGRPTILLPETWNQCGLHSSGWLVPLFAPEAKTGRIVMKSKITSSNSVRIYLAWRDPSGKIATIGQKTPAGNITASFFRTYQTDGIGCGLIQVETGSLATSLIDTASGKTASRAASSAVVNTESAQRIKVYYSDGAVNTYETPDKTFVLPYAAKNWGERYIQKIEFLKSEVRMPTERISLSSTPIQITDGTECALIRVEKGSEIFIADSDVMPDDLSQSQSVGQIVVNPPFVVWAWSEYGSEVSVTKRRIS